MGNYEAEDLAPEMKLLIQLWLSPLITGTGLVILIAQYTKQSSTAKDQLVNKRGYCEKKGRKRGLNAKKINERSEDDNYAV